MDKKKWIAAINRFKNVINYYDTTIYVEESLYRLVEVHYLLGLTDESKSFASRALLIKEISSWERLLLNVYLKSFI